MESAIVTGIPGAGKTTRGMGILTELQKAGVPLLSVGYATYTRAARREASQRACDTFGVTLTDLEKRGWFRTIHSAVMKLLGVQKGELVTGDKDWFAKNLGAPIETHSPEDGEWAEQYHGESDPAQALKQWDLARNRLVPIPQVYDEAMIFNPRMSIHYPRHLQFIEAYEEAKTRDGRSDFTDFLLRYSGWKCTPRWMGQTEPEGPVPNLVAWILDECQDTSTLLDACARRLCSTARWTYLLGDPLQNIYQWAGSDPGKFLGWPIKKKDFLHKSWRCSEAVLMRAMAFVRQNHEFTSDLESLIIEPAKPGGDVSWCWADSWSSKVAADPATRTLVMARTNKRANSLAAELTARGVPWRNNRTGARFPNIAASKLAAAFYELEAGGVIDGDGWSRIVEIVPKELLARGAKTKFKARSGHSDFVTLSGLAYDPEFGSTQALADLIGAGKWRDLIGNTPEGREAIAALACQQKWGSLADDPQVIVSTIHATKGMEADRVYLDTKLSYPVQRQLTLPEGREVERRVWYVGMTRAKDHLCLIRPEQDAYDEIFDYI